MVLQRWPTLCRSAVAVLVAIVVASCGTITRESGPVRLADTVLTRAQDPTVDLADAPAMARLGEALSNRVAVTGKTPVVLAISGGGANGAYGAGILTGWSARGDRPEFDVVTGVSTGALSAPFAFLGADWDPTLREAYTSGQTEGLISLRSMAAFFAPSLFSPSILTDLVDTYVTPELLTAVASEHAKGRRLFVVTTNLDSERPVIWDMGVIASQKDDNALTLFRQVLVASASIPGVFPPVLIASVRQDGMIVREMHVDGGVTVPFLASPLSFFASPARPTPETLQGSIYVIINGQAEPHYAVTSGKIGGILARTYSTSSKATTARELAAARDFAADQGVTLSVTAIPSTLVASSLDFSQGAMQRMFDLGFESARSNTGWRIVTSPDQRPVATDQTARPTEAPATQAH